MSPFANTIFQQKYAEPGETWEDAGPGSKSTPRRVVENVMGPYFPHLVEEMITYIAERKFMPGGRYLYATGKRFHQTQNCLLLKVEDSRESISDLLMRVSSGLMTGAGIGIVWSALREEGALVKGMGGKSTGPLAFMQMVNETGRHIMQGGSRRAAIWAGLHWWHPDVFKFIHIKDWSDDIKAMKAKDFNAYAPMDMTNISVILDDEFFDAYDHQEHEKHEWAQAVYWEVIEQMLTTGEPGFSIDVGVNAGENLRNAPVAAYTKVLTSDGYRSVGDIVGEPTSIWTGKQWASDVVFKETDDAAQTVRVRMTGGRIIDADPSHPFLVERYHGAGTRRRLVSIDRVPAGDLKPGDVLHVSLPKGDAPAFSHTDVLVVSVEPHVVQPVYCADVRVEEHSFQAEGVIISNCTEVTSADDNDICNLGSINLARVESLEEMERLTKVGTAFLLCGTLYSKVPYEGVEKTRTKNRRLGLGLMGIYEWLVVRGKSYGPDDELATWLDAYARSGEYANAFADFLGVSRPVKTRAIAPTGTIGILAETTTGIEPLFAIAMKRRYLKGTTWHFQYVIDALAQRLIDKGIDPAKLETAYDLANDPERRIAFQAWVQQWVDHGISSTLNLPSADKQTFDKADFGNMLMTYLPSIRGVTVYPDGARGGQPLNVVSYDEAKDWVGYEYEEFGLENACVGGVCGV
jgi:ribonucleotide reductase alpha subunit